LGGKVLLRDLLIDETHEVDEVGGRSKNRPTMRAVAVVLTAEKVLEARNLLEVAPDIFAHVLKRCVRSPAHSRQNVQKSTGVRSDRGCDSRCFVVKRLRQFF